MLCLLHHIEDPVGGTDGIYNIEVREATDRETDSGKKSN